jgi:hypothetical protein
MNALSTKLDGIAPFISPKLSESQMERQVFCDLPYTTEILSRGIFTLRLPYAVKWTSQAALQSSRGKRGGGPLAFFCMVHCASAVIHAAAGMANLQVFCRKKSGNGCPVSVCL